jgi:DNA-binding MarR family transcriptional regulator
MADRESENPIDDFLGSAHVFVSTLDELIEEALLRETLDQGITSSQLKLLKLVAMADTHTIGDVAAFLGISNAAASKAVDKLVQRMFLHRAEAADRRAINLSLTDSGRRVLEAYHEEKKKRLADIFRDFSPEELRRVAEMLDRFSSRILERNEASDRICLQCGLYFREKCLMRNLLSHECLYHQQKGWDRSEPAT